MSSKRIERGRSWVALLVMMIFGATAVFGSLISSSAAAPTKPFSGSGTITGSNPGSAQTGGVTENDWQGECIFGQPFPPQSQGLDGLVFQLPESHDGETALAKGSSPAPYDLDLAFYDKTCAYIDNTSTAAADETAPVPAATQYIVVDASLGANIGVCLTVGGGTCGSGSASASASASAVSPSASSSSPPPHGGSIGTSIASSQSKVTFKKPFILSGHVTADAGCKRPYHVTITKRVPGGRPKVLTTKAAVSRTNTWQYRTSSQTTATYSAVAHDSGSCKSHTPRSTTVGVHAKVRVRKISQCVAPQAVRGKVRPNHPFTRVLLKRGKKTVSKANLNARSGFRLTAPSCSGKFNVFWPKQGKKNLTGLARVKF
ncbi:MAG: extracellular elastinolytic metalloproteinase [Actinomycetota bacterium]|nr:extracellular elastinolytic metalloproteinase [Actinomycetota bacterium]